MANSHSLFVYAGTKPLGTNAASPKNVGNPPLWTALARLSVAKCKIDFLVANFCISLLTVKSRWSASTARFCADVLDADDASNAYVHFSDCLVDAVLRQHGGVLAQFGNSVFRVAVHGLKHRFTDILAQNQF